ncbi:N-acyl-D-amino-acid deacylase family protein [Brachybacterium phenoliresistens]|uniref:N-acyl-D-amino-acid deacylase family protein n=1 Tax=Brachybacterium phenoliresistens TaxID=396014 RepID=UPI0004B50A04|nr:D-aminoacylase [Brachybacterium phenoliresistens]
MTVPASPAAPILLRGAQVLDGTGAAGFRADVLVREGRIAAIGRSRGEVAVPPGTHRIDADGQVLAPGFIDLHSHADLRILLEPAHPSRITQGFTTEVLGQDGLSYAPVTDAVLPELRAKIAGWNGDPEGFDWSWRGVGQYLDRLDQGIATNAAHLVPHGTVRAVAAGWEDAPLTAAQLARMEELVSQGLAEGAVGLSTGLTYTPAMYAGREELVRLCRVVAAAGGVFAPHTRSYGAGALEAYREVLEVARDSGCALHLTHATMNFPPNAGRAGELLALVDAAIAEGGDVTVDSYPYLAGATTLAAVLPSWASAGGLEATLGRLADPAALARIREALEVTGSDGCHGVTADWETIEISGVSRPELSGRVGRTIAQIARAEGIEPFAVLVDQLRRDRLATGILQHVGHEENVRAIQRHPAHLVGSDGLLVGAKPHPRAWGTAPQLLGRYVRELGDLTLEEAIAHLTGRAARRLRLRDRGLVREGWAADLVLFDPETIAPGATYEHPREPAIGISWVLVNGRAALAEGEPTGALAGRALRLRDGEVAAAG